MKPWREKGWWLLAAAIVLLFWQPLTTATFFFRDLYLLFYPKKLLLASALRSGEIPLWDPLMHGGQPFLASPNNTFFAPSNLLYLVLPPLTAFNVVFVLQFLLCGWAAYFLGRVLRFSQPAAFACGATYALCGYALSTANLLPLVLSIPWVPATFAFAHLLATEWRGRWLVLGSITAALPLLSGAAELTAMMFTATGIWLLFGPMQEVPLRRRLLAWISLAAFAVALSLAQTVPAVEMIGQSARGSKQSFENFSQWSLHPRRLPELVIPGFFGPTDALEESDYWGLPFEGQLPYILSIYIGSAAVLLVIAGAMRGSPLSRRARICLLIVAVAGVVLSFGRWLPLFRLVYDYVPLVGIFRYPIKAMMLALVPMAILAGAGVEALRHQASPRLMLVAAVVAATLLGAFLLRDGVDTGYFSMDLKPELQSHLSRGLLQAAGVSVLFVLLLALQRFRARDLRAMAATLVLFDLLLAGYGVNAYAPRELFAEMPLAAAVRGAVGDGRFYSAPQPEFVMRAPENHVVWLAWDDRRLLRGYTAAAFGIPMMFHNDYDGLAPLRMLSLARLVDRMAWPRRLDVLERGGVTAFLSPDRVERGDSLQKAVVDTGTRTPLFLYRDNAAIPFRFASRVVAAADDGEALRAVVTTPFAADSVVLSTGRPQTPPCGAARGTLVRRSLNALTVEIDAPCDGYLVMSETFYPGWRATVDGRPAEILRADYAFTAVPVSRGRHVVQKIYRPRPVIVGAAGSLMALGSLIAVAIGMRRRRQRSLAAV